MRYIDTKKNFVQLVEVDDNNGKILSSRGFQFGELYFQIKNKKVTFYLNDSEVPYRNDIWTVNIPLQINDEVYDDEESASDALGEIMNDSFQEQLDELKEGLAAESARAEEAEEQLDSKIDDETSRAISAETHLQDKITEVSGTVATFDGRITKNTNDISALNSALQVEVERAISKDATHDAQISGLTTNLQNETARAISAETQLHNDIINEQNRALAAESGITANLNAEIQNRIADVDAEEARALAAESSITENLNSEISRSTEKDAQHDAQISALTVSLNNEINRATEAENDLRSDLNDEIADRISGDTNLQNQLDAEITRAQNAEEGLDDKIDGEISRANSEETRIEGKLDAEITRSTSKDVEHDTLISGLTDDLASEVSRATAKENQLDTKIDAEIANRISDVDAEETRALAAESGITSSINAEITRATNAETALNEKVNAISAYNASQDVQISGVSNSINTEISRATSVENALRSDLNDETSARTSADASMLERIVAVEVGKADANNVYTKAESDDKYATKEYMSGFSANYYDKNATNELLAAKADKVNAVASAEYVSASKKINFKNIDGTVISEVDATSFIKDGMVDNVEIVNGNLVITFNTDSGKEPISIPLSSIFDPSSYYTKTEINNIENAQNSKINEISGKTDDVITEVQTLSGEVQTISGESVTTGEVQTMIDGAVSGKQDTLVSGTNIKTINNESILGEGNIEIQGGGSSYTGVSGVTINNNNEIYYDGIYKTWLTSNHSNDYAVYWFRGRNAKIWISDTAPTSSYMHWLETQFSFGGVNNLGNSSGAVAFGQRINISGFYASSFGQYNDSKNQVEFSVGQYNTSSTASTTFGDSGNTLFSVGNGTSTSARHNAFEIRQNGDIYLTKDGQDVKLQDQLGGGSSYTAGDGIDITNDVISVTGKVDTTTYNTYTAATDTALASKADTATTYTKSEVDTALASKQTTLTAGSGISISNNVISAKIWSGTIEQYNQLPVKESDCIYLIYE